MINQEHIYLLQIISDALHEKKTEFDKPDNWPAFAKELKSQAISGLIASNIKNLQLNRDDVTSYLAVIGRVIHYFYSVMEEQKTVLSLLDDADIPVVVIKGAAAAMNYPAPQCRSMGDIDIIVPTEKFELAYNKLSAAGYEPEQKIEEYNRHVGFKGKRGVEIELHHHFSARGYNKPYGELLDQYIYNGIRHREKTVVCGYPVYILPSLENGLVLLAHINQHLKNGIGLRHIIDWVCYVERCLDDERWNEFSAAADRIGMKTLAIATTAMCKKYLGLENITWCDSMKDDPICDELMEYILNHGNFGRKNAVGSKSVNRIRWIKNPFKALAVLQELGCKKWDLYKKYHWLKPFAWAYQIFTTLKRDINHGLSLEAIINNARKEEAETELLTLLGVTKY